MKIGIIGTGNIGSTLIRKFRKLGHEVKITNSRGPDSLKDLAIETGALPVSIIEAVKDVELVVISIPFKAVLELPKDLFRDGPRDLIIVDTGNYYPFRDGIIPGIDAEMPESVWVSEQIGRPVFKIFNNILAESLAKSEQKIVVTISGDDTEVKKKLFKLVDDIGFVPYDAGSLEDSWRLQPGSPAYCTALNLEEMPSALKRAKKELVPKRREEAIQKFMANPMQDPIQMNRELTAKD